MRPIYKYTLINAIEGVHETEAVENHEEIEFIHERDPEYWGLFPLMEAPLLFYADARDYITRVIQAQGLDATLYLKIGISTDEGLTFDDTVGTLSLDMYERTYNTGEDYKIKVPFAESDIWRRFMNRKSTPVPINSNKDLSGNVRFKPPIHELQLTPQIIRQEFRAGSVPPEDPIYAWSATDDIAYEGPVNKVYIYFPWQDVITDEIDERFDYPLQIDLASPTQSAKYLLKAKYAGNVFLRPRFNFSIILFASDLLTEVDNAYIRVMALHEKKSGEAVEYVIKENAYQPLEDDPIFPYQFGMGIEMLGDDEGITIPNVGREDRVYLYAEVEWLNGDSPPAPQENITDAQLVYSSDEGEETEVYVYQDTEYPETTAESYLVHDALLRVMDAITEKDGSFYSAYFANQQNTNIMPVGNGEGSFMALLSGLNIRGYTQEEKPLALSAEDLWKGLNPLHNLALYIEVVNGRERLRIEPKETLFNAGSGSVHTFTAVRNIAETAARELYHRKITVGFEEWKSESDGGLDDPQTVHEYALRFEKFGEDLQLLSKFYMAALGIESARRKRPEETEDYRLDDEIMAIALGRPEEGELNTDLPFDLPQDLGASSIVLSGLEFPELDEYIGASNLLNPDRRYNLRFTPKRSLLRWGNVINGGLLQYSGSKYQFQRGEGNYDMVSQWTQPGRGDYSLAPLSEKQDVEWDYNFQTLENKPIFQNVFYEFDVEITYAEYKTITSSAGNVVTLDNGITQIEGYIMRIAYKPETGKASVRMIKKYA